MNQEQKNGSFLVDEDEPAAYKIITPRKRGMAETGKTRATRKFHETIWKITSSLILIKPAMDEKLMFALTRAPLKLFQAATMKVK